MYWLKTLCLRAWNSVDNRVAVVKLEVNREWSVSLLQGDSREVQADAEPRRSATVYSCRQRLRSVAVCLCQCTVRRAASAESLLGAEISAAQRTLKPARVCTTHYYYYCCCCCCCYDDDDHHHHNVGFVCLTGIFFRTTPGYAEFPKENLWKFLKQSFRMPNQWQNFEFKAAMPPSPDVILWFDRYKYAVFLPKVNN